MPLTKKFSAAPLLCLVAAAGLAEVPALVREQEDAERLQVALIENMAREDLNPVDEARACATLVEDLGLSKEELGRRIGRSRAAVSNLIRLLDLPDEAIALMRSGDLSEGHGRAILIAKSADGRRALARGRCQPRVVPVREDVPAVGVHRRSRFASA